MNKFKALMKHYPSSCLLYILSLLITPNLAQGQEAGIRIQGGASIVTSGSSSLVIKDGSFLNYGTFYASPDNHFIMEGTSPQNITGGAEIGFSLLTINNTGGVTLGYPVEVSRILLCNGILNSDGNLTLLATETGTALIDGSGVGSVNGVVTMQRFLPSRYGYTYISSPFLSSLVGELSDESVFSVYRYDENKYVGETPVSGWENYNVLSNVLYPMNGYAVNFGFDDFAATIDMSGIVNNGEISLQVYNHNHIYTQGFNLVGNPYPSPVDWNQIRELSTNLDDALYVFRNSSTDPFGGVYSTYINGISGDGTVSNIIPSMEGFFVHVIDGPSPVTGNLRMNNSVRGTGLTKSIAKSGSKSSNLLIRLTSSYMNSEESTDYAVIYFDDKATEEFDGSLDALKLLNTDLQAPNLFSITPLGKSLSINALPGYPGMPSVVHLGLKIQEDGLVVFGVSEMAPELESLNFYFLDSATGIEQKLIPGMDYKVTLAAGEYRNRFYLNLSGVTTTITKPAENQEFFNARFSGDNLKIELSHLHSGEGLISIYNLVGQQLYGTKIKATGHYDLRPDLKKGIYIVSLTSGGVRTSKKLIKSGW